VAGADALSVAQQLSAANRPGQGRARTWLIESAPALVIRAPQLAADLLRRELDDSESKKIRRLAGARHAPADWSERARIIALSWDGLAVPAIAAKTGCHGNTVRRWLHRFNAAGIDGLSDRPGAGRKRRITEAHRSAIIALARSVPPGRLARDPAGELSADSAHLPARSRVVRRWAPDQGAAGVPVQPRQQEHPGLAAGPSPHPARLHPQGRMLARPWIWGRPQPKPRSHSRHFIYTF
jgi:hypothetical protein